MVPLFCVIVSRSRLGGTKRLLGMKVSKVRANLTFGIMRKFLQLLMISVQWVLCLGGLVMMQFHVEVSEDGAQVNTRVELRGTAWEVMEFLQTVRDTLDNTIDDLERGEGRVIQ